MRIKWVAINRQQKQTLKKIKQKMKFKDIRK